MQDVEFRKEKISLATAIDLISICSNEEAEELYKAIEKVSPTRAIQAREIRRLSMLVKAEREAMYQSLTQQKSRGEEHGQ